MDVDGHSAAPGRPREFCTDKALAAALSVFWSKGYDGTSLTDLTSAMGINRPSLYAAFGNKEALFRKALALYAREQVGFIETALAADTARGVAERVLKGALALYTGEGGPRGCLYAMHASTCGAGLDAMRAEIAARITATVAALTGRFERAAADHDLADGVEPAGLARILMAIVQGMATQAGAGVARQDLERLVETTLKIWPSRATGCGDRDDGI